MSFSVLVLYNQPLLPPSHPDAESEHTVVAVAERIAAILNQAGITARLFGMAPDPSHLWDELKRHKPDVVFNLFEGNPDHVETESYVAGLLDWAKVPYTGCPFATLTLARMKPMTKLLLKGAGLPTADFQVVHQPPAPTCELPFPVIVKPGGQDASVGVSQKSVCQSQAEVAERVQLLFGQYGPPVLIERYVDGREFNVGLIELPELQTLPIAEIVFPRGKPGVWPILTYEGKWEIGSEAYTQTPSRHADDLPAPLVAELNLLARTTYRLLGCRDYARVDFRVTPEGRPFILEVNPNPEISPEAQFTGCLGSAALPHGEFVVRLARQALTRSPARLASPEI